MPSASGTEKLTGKIVVKSRLQAATHKYKSSVRAVLDILNKEGLAGMSALPPSGPFPTRLLSTRPYGSGGR